MLLHFHRKALALESIEGVDSDHIVVDGLTVVETSLQEGGLGIIQLEKGTRTALVAYLSDTMTTLCCSYGILRRDELLKAVFCSLTLFISPRRSWLSAATR